MGMVLSVLGMILVTILKIIFILILVVCALLILPIRYKVDTKYQKEFSLESRVTWLGAIVFFRFSYLEGSPKWMIRIFGIDIQKVLAKRKEREKRKKANRNKKATKQNNSENSIKTEQRQREIQKSKNMSESSERNSKTKETTGKKEGNTVSDRNFLRKGLQSIQDKWNSIKLFVKSIFRLLQKIKKKAEWTVEVRNFIREDNTRRMVCILKDNVVHLWRKLKPRVLRGNIIFGTGDPCSTGEILGLAAIFYAYYGKGVCVTPDFEEARLEGTLFIKGRISLITILIILIRIFFSGEWNQFKNDMDQLKEAL